MERPLKLQSIENESKTWAMEASTKIKQLRSARLAKAEVWSSECSNLAQACTHSLKDLVTNVVERVSFSMKNTLSKLRKRKSSRSKSIKELQTTTSTSSMVKQTSYQARNPEMLSSYAKSSHTKSSREKELIFFSRRQSLWLKHSLASILL